MSLKRLLEDVDEFAERAEDVVEPEPPAADAHRVNEEIHEGPVGDAEGEKDAEV